MEKSTKPVLIGLGGLDGVHVAQFLASKGLHRDDVILIDATQHKTVESIKSAVEEAYGKPVTMEALAEMLEEAVAPKEKPFLYSAGPKLVDAYYPTRAEVESYHPFAKFIGKRKKR